MNEELLRAIQENQRWLAQFNRREYAGAFQTYVKQYGPRYMAAVQSAGEGALPAMAAALLDHLETGWLACRPWRRSAACGADKQMLALYLSPMLLGLEEPGCQRLAELLKEEWRARRPGDSYETVAYREIQEGFRNAIMGIEIPSRR